MVAVSGGIDSMVLLHALHEKCKRDQVAYKLVVAHFDHGIRSDSTKDRQFVQRIAKEYALPFVYDRVELGAGTSEAVAREARYAFLSKVQQSIEADAIVTAHHEDDVLETIIINWLRGTKSRGLSSLRSTAKIRRPMLGVTKKQIQSYARFHKLKWREDSTNKDETYLRNYIRKHVVKNIDPESRVRLLEHSAKAATLNDAIHQLVVGYIAQHTTADSIERNRYRELPRDVAREVLVEWIRSSTPIGVTTKLILRLDAAIRSGRNGSQVDIARGYTFKLTRDAALLQRDSS